jgi:hypothetical protein
VNRRRFLQFTIALAACAPIAHLPSALDKDEAALAAPSEWLPTGWVPSQDQVDEWLTYYKMIVSSGCARFGDVMNTLFADMSAEDRQRELDLLRQAEYSFHQLEHDRAMVAVSQGAGYAVGREGLRRCNPDYSAASNEAFGWYNGWAQGSLDYHRVKLPRSTGVTRPA